MTTDQLLVYTYPHPGQYFQDMSNWPISMREIAGSRHSQDKKLFTVMKILNMYTQAQDMTHQINWIFVIKPWPVRRRFCFPGKSSADG